MSDRAYFWYGFLAGALCGFCFVAFVSSVARLVMP